MTNAAAPLDAYNNVPVVGHCHPYVVDALTRQARTLNTHTRYLAELPLQLAEELLARRPSSGTLSSPARGARPTISRCA